MLWRHYKPAHNEQQTCWIYAGIQKWHLFFFFNKSNLVGQHQCFTFLRALIQSCFSFSVSASKVNVLFCILIANMLSMRSRTSKGSSNLTVPQGSESWTPNNKLLLKDAIDTWHQIWCTSPLDLWNTLILLHLSAHTTFFAIFYEKLGFAWKANPSVLR